MLKIASFFLLPFPAWLLHNKSRISKNADSNLLSVLMFENGGFHLVKFHAEAA